MEIFAQEKMAVEIFNWHISLHVTTVRDSVIMTTGL